MIKIVTYFDYIDFEHDNDYHSAIFADMAQDLKLDFHYVKCQGPSEVASAIIPGSVVLVDYGALSNIGQTGFINHLNRFFEKLINDYQSVTFVYVLTMGSYFYENDTDIFKLSNVKQISSGSSYEDWKELIVNLIKKGDVNV